VKVFLPSWNGDFRLEQSGVGEGSVLILHNPTPHELVVVGDFLRGAKKKGWWSGETISKGSPYRGALTTIPIEAPIEKASRMLIRVARPQAQTLTAVKFSGGQMEVIEGATSEALTKAEAAIKKAVDTETPASTAVAASVKRPTPSCPDCQLGSIAPASEVLLSFLNEEEHKTWRSDRAIIVEGGLSGHRYLIAHRNSPLAVDNTRICSDLDDNLVVHFHDWGVPPEEEVLAAKLILEHCEPWLRNEATCYHHPSKAMFKNPFGDVLDGTESAAFAQGVGSFLRNMGGSP
jgi:hypothetical protein